MRADGHLDPVGIGRRFGDGRRRPRGGQFRRLRSRFNSRWFRRLGRFGIYRGFRFLSRRFR